MNSCSTFESFIAKLDRLAALDQDDRDAILALPFDVRSVRAHYSLVRQGETATHCCILLAGYACRSKTTREGARQIVSFHMAGDILDLHHLLLSRADHDVQTIAPASIAWVLVSDLRRVVQERPALSEALWRDTLIAASISREWVLNVGQRSAKSRVAHLLCEFASRHAATDAGPLERFTLPMTQEVIGDACGLTGVHVNRMLSSLAKDNVITRNNRLVTIKDWARLRHIADFDATYLHVT